MHVFRHDWRARIPRALAGVWLVGIAACGADGSAGPTTPSPTPAADDQLLTLAVSCHASLLIGERAPCVAAASYRSGRQPVVSFESTWFSSPPDVVAVDGLGVSTGKSAGHATVTANGADAAIVSCDHGAVPCDSLTVRLVALLLTGVACAASCQRGTDESVVPPPAPKPSGLPSRLVVQLNADRGVPTPPEPEWRWGRADGTPLEGRYHPTRDDWQSDPTEWELVAVANVPSIPKALALALGELDCTIPRSHAATRDESVISGEFERAGQRDIAVLCVHSDHSSSTYVFWNGDPARVEAMPGGNGIITVPQRDVEAAADATKPVEADMPPVATHDGIDIGCCECCSTIFYRHGGKWFTLPGAD